MRKKRTLEAPTTQLEQSDKTVALMHKGIAAIPAFTKTCVYGITLSERAILHTLATYGTYGEEIYPGYATLGKQLGKSAKTIERILIALRSKGYVHVIGKHGRVVKLRLLIPGFNCLQAQPDPSLPHKSTSLDDLEQLLDLEEEEGPDPSLLRVGKLISFPTQTIPLTPAPPIEQPQLPAMQTMHTTGWVPPGPLKGPERKKEPSSEEVKQRKKSFLLSLAGAAPRALVVKTALSAGFSEEEIEEIFSLTRR